MGHGAAGLANQGVGVAGSIQTGMGFLKGIGKKLPGKGGRTNTPDPDAPSKPKDGDPDSVRPTCSFSAETLVATSAGAQPIAALEPGDTVLAYNEADQTTGSYTVTTLLVSTDTVLVDLQIDAEPINTTPEHPFFTHERGWVAAEDLALGDRIRAADGTWGVVERLLLRGDTQVMYNLTVATAHTFFVGEGQWLVHNLCLDPVALANEWATARTFKNWVKNLDFRNPNMANEAPLSQAEARAVYDQAKSYGKTNTGIHDVVPVGPNPEGLLGNEARLKIHHFTVDNAHIEVQPGVTLPYP